MSLKYEPFSQVVPCSLGSEEEVLIPVKAATVLLLLYYSPAWSSVIHKSMSLKYEPSSEARQ